MRFTIVVSGIPVAVSRVKKSIDKKAHDFVSQLWNELVDATPVASGRAAASWLISSGPSVETLPPGEYGRPVTPLVPDVFSELYIVNPLDYVVYLNEGSSEQAPALFIETTLRDVEDRFSR